MGNLNKNVLDAFTNKELLEELNSRVNTINTSVKHNDLLIAIVCYYNGSIHAELFKKIEKESDLKFLRNFSLRSRFNSYRNYQLLYWKANYDTFKKLWNNENFDFGNFLESIGSIKKIKI